MKYLHFIKLMKQNCEPNKEQIYNDIISQKSNAWIKILAIACSIVLLLGIAGVGTYYGINSVKRGNENHLPDELYNISPISAITATLTKGEAVLQNTSFEITTKDVHSAKDIYSFLEISPKTEYTVKKTSGNTFNVEFSENLKDNTLYNLSSKVGSKTVYSWAFQTESKFQITASCGGKTGCAKMSQTQEIWVEFSRSDVKNFEQYFSINPAVSGTFEQYGKRWVFIPSSDFAKNTVYNVTISKDIISGDGQTLGNDYSFNIYSCLDSVYANCLSPSYGGDRFTTTQTPTAVIEYKNVDMSKATVKVYRSSSPSKFISIFNQYVKGGYISSSIAERFKEPGLVFDTTLKTDPANNRAYLSYPEPLETGFYIAQIILGDVVTYHLFEVSDYDVFATYANGKISLWVNDMTTQTAVSGVAIVDDHGNIKSTDQNGTAVIEHNPDNQYAYFNISTAVPTSKIINIKKSGPSDIQSNHYGFMRTDKAVYNTGDTVKLFGFTHSKDYSTQDKYEVKCSWKEETIKVTPNSSGVFEYEITTDNVFADKKAYIDLYVNGMLESTTFIDIYCTKPNTNIQISTDSNCYIEGETVTYSVFATLRDGTPAKNITVNFNNALYTTNDRGLIEITETATTDGDKYVVREFKVGEQSYFVDYTVFKSNNIITDVKKKDDGTLDVFVNTVDKNAPDFLGAPAECEVKAELYAINYVQNGTSPYYDTLTLQVINDPVYSVNSVLQNTETVNAVGGVANIPITENDRNSYYVIKAGNDEYRYSPATEVLSEYADTNMYSLQYKTEYKTGENITAVLCKNSPADVVTEGGQVFISFVSGDAVKTEVFNINEINFVFDDDFKYDVIVGCAYMTGGRIYNVTAPTIKKKANPLKVAVKFDKTDYAPGDTVNMDINIKGSDGYPVQAVLSVNVYDSMFYRENGVSNANNGYLPSPLFETVETDGAGNAKVSFTLDKKVANWKADILAFDKNANSGKLVCDISAKSSIYVDAFVSEKIYVENDLSFSFRVDGTAVTEQYDYSAVLLKDGVQIATKSGITNHQQVKNENFGKLVDTGNYTIKIICASGENSCETEKQFELVSHSKDVTELTIKDNTDIEKDKYNSDITVSVYDAEYELYFKVIEKMLEKSSDRIDLRLANTLAKSIANGENILVSDLKTISEYATNSGIFVYPARVSATNTQAALISTAANDLFDKITVKEYFERVLKGRPDNLNLIAINSVFASIGEPVLFELNNLYKNIAEYTDEEKLYLALAFANAGDFNRAYSILNDGLTDKILTANGVATFEADTPTETEYMSVLAATVTSKLSQVNAKDLVKGLMNTDDSTLTGIAYYTFIKDCVPYLEGQNSIEFKDADGKEQNITYSKTESVSFNVKRKDIDKINLKSVDGNNVCTITSKNSAVNSGYKKVENRQSTVTLQNGEITDGSTVKITMVIDTADSNMKSPYAVFDIPHGLKLIKATVTGGSVTDEGIINISGSSVTAEFECYAATEGQYTVFAPTVIDKKSKQFIDGASVTIKVN